MQCQDRCNRSKFAALKQQIVLSYTLQYPKRQQLLSFFNYAASLQPPSCVWLPGVDLGCSLPEKACKTALSVLNVQPKIYNFTKPFQKMHSLQQKMTKRFMRNSFELYRH